MAVSIDQQFIEYIVRSLVGHPDDVVVDRIVDEKGVLLTLTVNPEDLGRVIGKRGATAQSLRSLLRALGTKNDARYNLKIVDVDRPESERDQPRQVVTPVTSDDSVQEDVTLPQDDVVVVDEPIVQAVETVEPVAEKESDLAAKTRKELAEYDDLDI
ncbi:MAG: KH domain-containing protein [Candidatus Saccharimonadales bacterium]